MDAVIRTEGLTKVYRLGLGRKTHRALDGLDLSVARGEVFGFLGPNGAGKTTTMKLLLGLLRPTSGSATVLGKSPTEISVKAKIGFLPEESYLYRFLTAEETLDFYARLFGIPRAERRRRTAELLDLVGMAHARRRRVGEFSKGMARRIGFAQALINDPEVIFLDEPTSGLDPLVSRRMKDLILDLKARGKTIFLSSHLLADVEDVCDRIGILFDGRLRRIGTVEELLRRTDATEVLLDGLSEAAWPALRADLERAGRRVARVQHPTDSLETLFLRTLQGDTEPAAPSEGPAASN